MRDFVPVKTFLEAHSWCREYVRSLPRPTRGEADARLRAAGEGPNLLEIPNLRRNRQSRHKIVPHPNPLSTWGEGIGGQRKATPLYASAAPVAWSRSSG